MSRKAVLLSAALAAVACFAACATETSPPGQPHPEPDWAAWSGGLAAGSLTDRFVEVSGRFLGTTYEFGPLGEGPAGGPDPDPRFDFERVDCVTYLEQSLALALVEERAKDEFLPTLDAIRYRNGEVSFPSRNHYTATDWIPANSWLLEDVTREVGGDRVRTVRRTIDRARFLREHDAVPRPGLDDALTAELAFIPRERAGEIGASLRGGDLVFWVGKREDLFIAHTGMLARAADGNGLLFRHASSRAGRVLDESFLGYAEGATFAEGFVVLRLRDEVRVPQRGGA